MKNKKKIDLSDIKELDLDKTSTFTDLLSKKERIKRNKLDKDEINDIEDMIKERKRSTKDLTEQVETARKLRKKETFKDEDLDKTKVLEITRAMKFNFNETKKEEQKKTGASFLNVIGEVNLLCIGYYIYVLIFTNLQDKRTDYLLNGSIIVLLVLLFGLSIVTTKKTSKFFRALNVIFILLFITFNILTILNII